MLTRAQRRELLLARAAMNPPEPPLDPQPQPQQPPDYAALIDALIGAANAAAAAVPPVPVAPPPARPAFALPPGMTTNEPIDYSTTQGLKLFNQAIKGIEPKFDLKEGNLNTFLSKLKEHARIFNWRGILDIPDSDGIPRNLMTNYGQLTIQDCKTHAATYVNAHSRDAQNSIMLYHCVAHTLDEEASGIALSNPSEFTVDGQPSGVCFLKAVIGRATIDTRAKVRLLRATVSNLPVKIDEFSCDLRKFNVYVDTLRESLMGHGQYNDEEMISHLFRAYERVDDKDFANFLSTRRDQYDNGERVTVDVLMRAALNKYNLIQQRAETESMINREPKEKIMALEAQLLALKATTTATNPRKKTGKDPFAWKKVKPKANEPNEKTVKGRKYTWCKFHQAWTIHAESDCRLASEKNNEDKDELVLARAYTAILESLDE
jgi:hypothetical protein